MAQCALLPRSCPRPNRLWLRFDVLFRVSFAVHSFIRYQSVKAQVLFKTVSVILFPKSGPEPIRTGSRPTRRVTYRPVQNRPVARGPEHSVPQRTVRNPANRLLAAEVGADSRQITVQFPPIIPLLTAAHRSPPAPTDYCCRRSQKFPTDSHQCATQLATDRVDCCRLQTSDYILQAFRPNAADFGCCRYRQTISSWLQTRLQQVVGQTVAGGHPSGVWRWWIAADWWTEQRTQVIADSGCFSDLSDQSFWLAAGVSRPCGLYWWLQSTSQLLAADYPLDNPSFRPDSQSTAELVAKPTAELAVLSVQICLSVPGSDFITQLPFPRLVRPVWLLQIVRSFSVSDKLSGVHLWTDLLAADSDSDSWWNNPVAVFNQMSQQTLVPQDSGGMSVDQTPVQFRQQPLLAQRSAGDIGSSADSQIVPIRQRRQPSVGRLQFQSDASSEDSGELIPDVRFTVDNSLLEQIEQLRRSLLNQTVAAPGFSLMRQPIVSNPVYSLAQAYQQGEVAQHAGRENFISWETRLRAWLQYTAQELTQLQQSRSEFNVQSQDTQQAIQQLTQLSQEIKKYVDNNLVKVWSKMEETWNNMQGYCQRQAEVHDAEAQILANSVRTTQLLQDTVTTVTQEQVPDLALHCNQEFSNLRQECLQAFQEAQKQVEQMRRTLHEVLNHLSDQTSVLQNLNNRLEHVENITRQSFSSASVPMSTAVRAELARLEKLYQSLNGKFGGLHLNQLVHQVQSLQTDVAQLMQQVNSQRAGSVAALQTQVQEQCHRTDQLAQHLNGLVGDVQDLVNDRQQLHDELVELRGSFGGDSRLPRNGGAYASAYTGMDGARSQARPVRSQTSGVGLGGSSFTLQGCRHNTHISQLEGGAGVPVVGQTGFLGAADPLMADYGFGPDEVYGGHVDFPGSPVEGIAHQTPQTPPQPVQAQIQSQTHQQTDSQRSQARRSRLFADQMPDSSIRSRAAMSQTNRPYGMTTPTVLPFSSREPSPVDPDPVSSSEGGQRFNPMVHQMVSEALKFEPWDGEWLELDEWLQAWQLYKEAACAGIPTRARTVLFLDKLPKEYRDFLRGRHLADHWTDVQMMTWLLEQKENRVPLHLRHRAWEQLRPKGGSFQHLQTWFQKWHSVLKTIQVTELQVLDQFDLSVKQYFGAGLTEILKAEQELKEKTFPSAKLNLEQRFKMLAKEITVADNVRALLQTSGSVSQAPRTSFSGASSSSSWYKKEDRRSVRTLSGSDRSDGGKSDDKDRPCHYCKEPGHWISDCPKRLQNNKQAGKCLSCGRSGHWSKECPRKMRRSRSPSVGSQDSQGSRHRSRSRSPGRGRPRFQREVTISRPGSPRRTKGKDAGQVGKNKKEGKKVQRSDSDKKSGRGNPRPKVKVSELQPDDLEQDLSNESDSKQQ